MTEGGMKRPEGGGERIGRARADDVRIFVGRIRWIDIRH